VFETAESISLTTLILDRHFVLLSQQRKSQLLTSAK